MRNNNEKQANVFEENNVSWTPTIAVLDAEGLEHYRFTGFLSPKELCARIILNGAKVEFTTGNYDLAAKCLNDVIEKYKGTFAVPEAIFYQGVVKYKSSDDAKFLRKGRDRLVKEFPNNEWTLRAKPYELISL